MGGSLNFNLNLSRIVFADAESYFVAEIGTQTQTRATIIPMSAPRRQLGRKAGKKSKAPKIPICPKFVGVVVTGNGTIAIRCAWRTDWQDFAEIAAKYGKKSALKTLDRWHSDAAYISDEMANQLWPVPELSKVNAVLFTETDEDDANILATADPVGDSASALSNDDIESEVASFYIKMARVSCDALLDLRNRVAATLN